MLTRAAAGRRSAALARAVLAAAILLPAANAARAGADSDAAACEIAGAEAERAWHLPPGLLEAIGAVESGRRDPVTQRVSAWPWTINAAGSGTFFPTRDEAVAEAWSRLASGTASIDVGCFQVNLLAHPAAFDRLETAFDPRANAAFAAGFLARLRDRTGSWDGAVAAYHSADAARGPAYRDTVMARWTSSGAGPGRGAPPGPAFPPAAEAWGMRDWTPGPPGSAAAAIAVPGAPGAVRAALPAVIRP
jgi:hypothetical protein